MSPAASARVFPGHGIRFGESPRSRSEALNRSCVELVKIIDKIGYRQAS